MSTQNTQDTSCSGHVRAQRFAMDYGSAASFEAEKAAITSYEDGWDSWDGPVWPWRETNVLPKVTETKPTQNTCCGNASDSKRLAPIRTPLLRTESSESTTSTSSELWHSSCPKCGHATTPTSPRL